MPLIRDRVTKPKPYHDFEAEGRCRGRGCFLRAFDSLWKGICTHCGRCFFCAEPTCPDATEVAE